ncbi:efflux RND transporter periplasmic adaptor subunit [Ralstonia pseudosolanacearum]|uniref:efflux RND transporter periplasmic adaptor subunit n=3 Tax=Ralstonia pseudosolanacearum TaxID=1310165 RepID=UPI00031B87E3|nr:efflux RND transporter periplasmic adaptor subunit [Ralstonia pseudosolanacearum]AOE92269.1 Membrane fusion protein MtrC [Ralstonia solanacearum]APF89935.1 efflux transporter periplasmic adaptor subunit [Ralstonia solanacearum FJAT-1458]ARS58547.1 efflux transporter periplasmic adaptor subunit [Ralstonia solanacearum FJAT-91]ESS50576.1 putative transport transmembrane protein [Ralstonia solanacearum SD54]AXV72481.1 efflux RND transporter periplasmic adaptor subunit [Ralstonia solanacearum]
MPDQTSGTHSGHLAEGPPHHVVTVDPIEPVDRSRAMRRARWVLIVVAVLLALGAVRTLVSRYDNAHALERQMASQATRYVNTVAPRPAAGNRELTLPGTLQGFVESPIYARTSGYVLRWFKDIGAHVEKGEVLALLDTPEVDQELNQAQAARNQAAARRALAQTSLTRWQSLRQKDAVSQQELDERTSAANQAQADLAAAEANVRRLQELQGFRRIVAPFAGVVTKRNVDVGTLVNAGNAGANRELFTLAQTDPLRIYLYVPQAYSQQVKVGQDVEVTLAELPGQVFHGAIARMSSAIDPATRTMQVEVSLPNQAGRLLPGAYVQAQIAGKAADDPQTAFVVPTNTLLFRKEGPRIAVAENGRVNLRPVTIGRDYGRTVEILSGLRAGDALILNPADSIEQGEAVTVMPASAPAASAPRAS